MAGSLTLGGMADGLLAGELVIGPASMNGKQAISEVLNVILAANVDSTIVVPSEAVGYCCIFEGSSAAEIKIGSNLIGTANGMPVSAQGFLALPLWSGITELKFKSAAPPSMFQLVFI